MADSRSDEALRQYLLGSLSDEAQRAEIELRLLADDDYFEQLLLNADDLTDEYLCGALTAAERERYERHFLSTGERQRRLSFARTLRKRLTPEAARESPSEESESQAEDRESRRAPDPASRPKWWAAAWRVPALRLAAFALLVAFAGLAAWRFFPRESDTERGLAALRSAYQGRRPVEARVSALGEYAPLVVTRGPDDAGGDDYAKRRRAEGALLEAADDEPGAAPHRALGGLYLAESRFDKAVEQFERALKEDARDARAHNDLGAALLERGKAHRAAGEEGRAAEDFARSLEHLNRALELDASLHAALFNRALTREQSQTPALAAADWELYLQRDPGSPWAEEARQHLQRLKERAALPPSQPARLVEEFLRARGEGEDDAAWALLSRNRDQAGGRIENALLDAHLEATLAARAREAAEHLDALDYAARLNEARAGDRYAADLVRFYRALPPARAAAPLAGARNLLKEGRARLVSGADPEGAARLYEQARAVFERHGDTAEAASALHSLGHCYLSQTRTEASLAAFRKVVSLSEESRHLSLLAQSLVAVANVEIGRNNYSDAVELSTRALEVSEQIGDTNGAMKALTQLGQEYLYLGDRRQALKLHRRSLDLAMAHSPEPTQLWRNYFTIAEPLTRLGFHAAAVEYMKESLRLALALDSRLLACRSYTDLGVMQGRRGDYEEATRNVRLAFELAGKIESPSARDEALAYSSLQLGHLRRRAGDFAAAVADYDRAVRFYDQLGSRDFGYVAHFSYAARKGRVLACLAGGDCPSAAEEIEAALATFERYREKILEERNRNTFFDAEQDICDVAVDYAYTRRGDAAAAFDYAERCRARSLLDMMGEPPQALGPERHDVRLRPAAPPLPAAELKAQLPERAQVLQYAVLADKVVVWVVRPRAEIESRAAAIARDELDALVGEYLRDISSAPRGEADAGRARAERLYDLLLRPVAPLLDGREQVCVVPDRALNLLPFGALASPETGRYAVEDFVFTTAPSASAFVAASRLARRKGGAKAERVLSVGDPAFDRKAFGALAELPAARREAEEVAALYGASAVVGAQATEELTAREMKRADLVHLALHSVADEDSPMRSKLLLAKGAGGAGSDGLLSAYEVYTMGGAAPRLVVLSACRTGVERYYGGEGMAGLARAFIAAGVPLVLASLWAVESEATAELMLDFHRARKGGAPTADALARAQRRMLADATRRHPYYWASFVTMGGRADF